MKRVWWRLRRRLARWWPWPVEGVGFAPKREMSSGEIRLDLCVEGRTGTVWLSREMWLGIGAMAGWVSEEEADAAWDEATRTESGANDD